MNTDKARRAWSNHSLISYRLCLWRRPLSWFMSLQILHMRFKSFRFTFNDWRSRKTIFLGHIPFIHNWDAINSKGNSKDSGHTPWITPIEFFFVLLLIKKYCTMISGRTIFMGSWNLNSISGEVAYHRYKRGPARCGGWPSALAWPPRHGGGSRQRAGKANSIHVYIIYIIQSEKSGMYYIGVTTDIIQRLRHHNSGANRSTKNRGPWRLVYQEKVSDKSVAWKREHQIKSYKGGRAFKRLINLSDEKQDGGIA